jgi:hemerythrin-like domain-containing protein
MTLPLRDTLTNEHGELAKLADRLLARMEGDEPAPGFSQVRWQLNRVLATHLTREDKLLYPQLGRSDDPKTRALARRFSIEMGGLAAEHEAYCRRWPMERILAEWQNFRRETHDIVAMLKRRIDREETELYSLMQTS